MDATSNPQTTAEQSRKNYRDVTTPAVPEAVRAMVEKAVDQSREVYRPLQDLSTHRLRPLRGPSTLLGKALWHSTAN